jgi:branched-chain amino acid transport system substrate-binding protein
MKKCLFILLAVFILSWTSPGSAAEPVKIGLIYPLSGVMAYDGQSVVCGAKLAAEEINKKGGVLKGQTIEIIVEDGQGMPAQSVAAAEKLINRDRVAAIMGALRSTASLAVQPIAEKNKTPMVTVISTAPKLTEGGYKYYFRTCPQEAMLVTVAAKFIGAKLGIKKLCYMGPNDEWGRAALDAWGKLMKDNGGELLRGDLVPNNETNFQPYLTRIKSLNPDAVAVQAETLMASMVFKQAKEMGLTMPFIGHGATASDEFIKLAGDAAEGVYSMMPYVYTYDSPQNKAFTRAYSKRFPDRGMPDKYSVGGYDGIYVIADAINKAGKADRESIRSGLAKVKSNRIQGLIKFDAKGQAHPLAFVAQNRKGVPQVIGQQQTKD